jgi:peptidoglycan hydrolase FlgJ
VAINPPSDIVLGSILAADPAKYRAAAERLKRAGGVASSEATPPAATSPEPVAEIATSVSASSSDAPKLPATPAQAAAARQAGKPPDVFAQLEAYVLQSFIQTMMPNNSQSFFGKGSAGDIWKSMLADKLGAQLASSGQVGLAKRLAMGRNGAVSSIVAPPALSGPVRVSPSLVSTLPYMQGSLPIKPTGRS